MSNTRSEVETETLRLIAATEASTEYNLDTVRGSNQNVYERICSWNIIRLISTGQHAEWSKIKAKKLPFLDKKYPINIYETVVTTDAVLVWATSIPCDTANLLDATVLDPKYVMIFGNIVSYTSKTATTLEWCSWLVIALDLWTVVRQVYLIDNLDVSKPKTLINQTNNWQFPIFYLDPQAQIAPQQYYTILFEWENRFLLTESCPSWVYRFNYTLQPPVLDTDNSTYLLPWDRAKKLIAPISAWELLWWSEETELWKEKLMLWYGPLVEFYGKFVSDIENQIVSIDFNFCTPNSILGIPSSLWTPFNTTR